MNLALVAQWFVVGVLVLASAIYSAWRLMPITARLRLLERLLPASQRNHPWPQKLRAALRSEALKTCGGCSAAEASRPASGPSAASAADRTQSAGAPRR